MHPVLHKSVAQLVIARRALEKTGCRSMVTKSGHVLIATPIDAATTEEQPAVSFLCRNETRAAEIDLVDFMHVFDANEPCFKCFFTDDDEWSGLAARIDGTTLWVLVTNPFGIFEVNECKTSINRAEWQDIQESFMGLLQNVDEGHNATCIVQ